MQIIDIDVKYILPFIVCKIFYVVKSHVFVIVVYQLFMFNIKT